MTEAARLKVPSDSANITISDNLITGLLHHHSGHPAMTTLNGSGARRLAAVQERNSD
jgi:hypothetical protein